MSSDLLSPITIPWGCLLIRASDFSKPGPMGLSEILEICVDHRRIWAFRSPRDTCGPQTDSVDC